MKVEIDSNNLETLVPHAQEHGLSVEQVVNAALKSYLKDNPNFKDYSARAFRAEVMSQRFERALKPKVIVRDEVL
jgi:hypothetical protein